MNLKIIGTIFLFISLSVGISAENNPPKSTFQTKPFGTYIIPEEWGEVINMTKGEKYFYAHYSLNNYERATNISVEMGRNNYAEKDHELFRRAIMNQLGIQVCCCMSAKPQIFGSGSYTKNNYILYTFVIEDKNEFPKVKTVQYYIVGEKKYILIQLTDFYNEEVKNAEKIARSIADSFQWADENIT